MSAAPLIPARLDRTAAIALIREGLKRRTGWAWSVSGGTGTAYGWIKIKGRAPRATDKWGSLSEEDAELLYLVAGGHYPDKQGISIPAASDYYRWYIETIWGITPTVNPQPYWD